MKKKIRNALVWPYRKYRLERLVTWYLLLCGGNTRDKEARRQARETILDGPYNPWNPKEVNSSV
jgi:hypothetical protein